MKFITNRIYTGKPSKSVDDLIKEAKASSAAGQIKTASAQQETKVAAFPAGHEHKFKANTEKLKGKGGKGAEEKKGKEKEACDETTASTETEIKVAESKDEETYDAGKKEDSEFTNDAEKKPEEATKEANVGDPKPAPAKGKDGLPTSGQPQWEGDKKNNNDPHRDPKAEDKAKSAAAKPVASTVKLSVPGGKYMVTANMKPELKKRTREFWLTQYPADYVDAMLSDK